MFSLKSGAFGKATLQGIRFFLVALKQNTFVLLLDTAGRMSQLLLKSWGRYFLARCGISTRSDLLFWGVSVQTRRLAQGFKTERVDLRPSPTDSSRALDIKNANNAISCLKASHA